MRLLQSPSWRVFFVVFAAGLAWALATGQEWEDFYITYRASKNLAEGKGLVFTEGQRVHSFTSPLGVLLPAASYLLTGRTSDVAALWIFRGMSLAALGGAAVLMWRILRRFCPATAAPAVLLVALLATDSKTLAFSVSGMETALLLLFFAWALWAVCLRPTRLALHLGLAWSGLMWSRPDSCVYIAAMGVGLLLFAPGEGTYLKSRCEWIRTIALAAVICAIVYAPWFAWAWSYYGTPVPHTITAKGLFNDTTAAGLAKSAWEFPRSILQGKSSLMPTFMPYYGGVPAGFGWTPSPAFALALIPLVMIFLPFLRWETRLASFLYVSGHVYLSVIVRSPSPWYLPQVAFFGMTALSLGFAQLQNLRLRWLPRAVAVTAVLAVLMTASLSVAMARQAYLEMQIIERKVRTAIGLYLREESKSSRESVFLEPLGFIGFYSGLKMLDFPGLCSPEVVAARRRADNRSYPYCWGELIPALRPDWLVLRPFEHAEIDKNDPLILKELYEHVKTFDVTELINQATLVPLKGYLEYNGKFEIYRSKLSGSPNRRPYVPLLVPITLEMFGTRESPLPVEPAGNGLKAHAPSRLVVTVPPEAKLVLGGFGIYEGAYAKPPPEGTDGAGFTIAHVAKDGTRTILLGRELNPAANAADRGLHHFDLDLPTTDGHLELTISAGPHHSNAYDWTYWYDLRFGVPPR